MYNKYQMKKKFNIVKFAISLLVLYFALESVFNAFYFANNYITLQKKKQELQILKKENQELLQKIEYAKTDEFIEKYARENLGLGKEGETIIYFKVSNSSNDFQQNSENFIKNLLNLFKK